MCVHVERVKKKLAMQRTLASSNQGHLVDHCCVSALDAQRVE